MRALRYAFLALVARLDLSARDALTLMGEPLADEGGAVSASEPLWA